MRPRKDAAVAPNEMVLARFIEQRVVANDFQTGFPRFFRMGGAKGRWV
ncbi:MAG: hypothetical protein AAFV96_16150 [Pseudomonadota bacterium]